MVEGIEVGKAVLDRARQQGILVEQCWPVMSGLDRIRIFENRVITMILIRAGKTNYLCSIDRTRCAAASSRSYQSLRDGRLPEPSLFTNLKRYAIKSDGSRLLFCFGHEHPPIL